MLLKSDLNVQQTAIYGPHNKKKVKENMYYKLAFKVGLFNMPFLNK